MRTILLYINTIKHGGAERVIIQLAKDFANRGYHTILLTSFIEEDEFEVPASVERLSIESEQVIQSRLKRNLSRIAALRKICKEKKVDVVIAAMAEPNFRAVIAGIGLPVKVIVSPCNDPIQEYPGLIGRIVGRYILPLADGCVFQTEEARTWFPKRLQRKSEIIFNDVATEFFEENWVGGGDIVTLGRLAPQKNQLLLIRAFHQIADAFPQVNLSIYGKGELQERLQGEIDRLARNDRIFLRGLTEVPAKVLRTCSLFALSSDYEGLPNVLLEAMAVGVPCISTDCPCGGPRMVIRSGENGLLVPVNDETELAEAMRRLLQDGEFARHLAENAKAHAQRFHPSVVFQQWEAYVMRVLQRC